MLEFGMLRKVGDEFVLDLDPEDIKQDDIPPIEEFSKQAKAYIEENSERSI